ncbi:MAG: DNA polymerase III subunit delta [Neisseriaceae bacterium]
MKPLYVIHGEEELFRFEALEKLRRRATKESYSRESLVVEAQFNWNELTYALESQGLFSTKKFIELHLPNGKPGRTGGELLQKVVPQLLDKKDISLLVLLPKLDKSQLASKWFKALLKVAEVTEAKKLTHQQLSQWLLKRLSAHNLGIEEEALLLFSERVEGNLLAAAQEVEKIALLFPPGHSLTLIDLQKNIGTVARFDFFQIAEAWMRGDIVRLLRLLAGLEVAAAELVILLWVVSEDIRVLIRLSGALKKGQALSSVRNTLKLWGTKQEAALMAIKRISPRRLIRGLQECATIDKQIKGVEKGEPWQSIRNLLSDLSR